MLVHYHAYGDADRVPALVHSTAVAYAADHATRAEEVERLEAEYAITWRRWRSLTRR